MTESLGTQTTREFFDTLGAGVILLDRDLQQVWANAYYRDRIASRLRMCEKHCFTGLAVDDVRCEDCLPPQVLRTGITHDTVRSVRDESGHIRSYRVVLTPIDDGREGVAVFLTPLATGDGEPGQAWRERFLLSAIRNGNDAVIALDRQHTVRFWNRGAAKLFGWSIEEAVGRTVDHLVPPDSEVATGVFLPTEPTAALPNTEVQMLSRTRGSVWVEVSRTPLLDGSGSPNGYSFVIRDVTERREAQERLAFAERMSAVGNMAAALAHEIGTPLGVISNNAEFVLLDLPEDDARREDLEVILSESERIGGLVRELLEFARPEKPEMEELFLESVLERVERLVRHSARKQDTKLVLTLADDTAPVRGDGNQLEQVVLNLTMNALQALGQGGTVELRLSIGVRPSGGAQDLHLTVLDDGPGLEDEMLERIFHPFFTTKPNGTGLGLAVCKRIVEEHGGHLIADRNEKRGAAFHVWLPTVEPEDSE